MTLPASWNTVRVFGTFKAHMKLLIWLFRSIDMTKPVKNKDRKFGADPYYYRALVRDADGVYRHALFTGNDVQNAITRAKKNPEDLCSGK